MNNPQPREEDDIYNADEYEQIFFTEDEGSNAPEYLFEEDGLYFNKKYKTNSRGVIKFPVVDVKNVQTKMQSQ